MSATDRLFPVPCRAGVEYFSGRCGPVFVKHSIRAVEAEIAADCVACVQREAFLMKRALILLVLCFGVAIPTMAQIQGGTISGTLQDAQGATLPGASVTLQGVEATREFVTASDGQFRFLDVPPGSYRLTIALSGFATII